jgi:glycosyltransferase involved in cell wall biosynthesis
MFKRLRDFLVAPLKAPLESFAEKLLQNGSRQEAELLKLRAQFKNRIDALSRQLDEMRMENAQQQADFAELTKKLADENVRQFETIDRLAADAFSRIQLGVFPPPPQSAELPKVTVVMPIWNRETTILRALQRLLNQSETRWECVVVDDGSEDASVALVQNVARNDPRIKLIQQSRGGASAARNAALRASMGTIIAYCDSDNVAHPDYLAHVVRAFDADSELMCAYTGQVVFGFPDKTPVLRYERFAWDVLRTANSIDLNVFSHRKEVFDTLGGFDENFDRVQDWDLILRYTKHFKTTAIPVIGGEYHQDAPHRISDIESGNYSVFQLKEKLRRTEETQAQTRPKVLHILSNSSELSGAGALHEIEAAAAAGFDVRTWPASSVPTSWQLAIPVSAGPLHAAIEAFSPEVIHIQGLTTALRMLPELEDLGSPLTIRADGREGVSGVVDRVLDHPGVRRVWLHPHQYKTLGAHEKLAEVAGGIHPMRLRPIRQKDLRLVILSGVTPHLPEWRTFVEIATACTHHHFILILPSIFPEHDFLQELNVMNRALGLRFSSRVNPSPLEMAECLSKAAIFMQASLATAEHPGPSIEMLEAMACGCIPLLERNAVFETIYGEAVPLWYDNSASAAAQIDSTLGWSEADWRRRRSRALDFVYPRHLCSETQAAMFADWRSAQC